MTTKLPVDEQPKDQAASVPAPDFAAQMHAFWEKNRSFVLMACAAVLLAIVAREGWEYFNEQHEKGIEEEYARAGDLPDKLASFAGEYPSHALAGIALLRVADAEYTSADFKTAAANYQKAAGSLADIALKSRARLGAAMSLLEGGDLAGGEAALKPLTTDTAADKVIRAEACYHLATLANDAGRADDVRNLTEEISKIDPMSVWAQRARMLRTSTPADAKPSLSLTPGK